MGETLTNKGTAVSNQAVTYQIYRLGRVLGLMWPLVCSIKLLTDKKEDSEVLPAVYKRDIRVQGELNHVYFNRRSGSHKTDYRR